jgi:hypothetical protein
LQKQIETVADDADLEELYNTEGDLLYVASGPSERSSPPVWEFLDDPPT